MLARLGLGTLQARGGVGRAARGGNGVECTREWLYTCCTAAVSSGTLHTAVHAVGGQASDGRSQQAIRTPHAASEHRASAPACGQEGGNSRRSRLGENASVREPSSQRSKGTSGPQLQRCTSTAGQHDGASSGTASHLTRKQRAEYVPRPWTHVERWRDKVSRLAGAVFVSNFVPCRQANVFRPRVAQKAQAAELIDASNVSK